MQESGFRIWFLETVYFFSKILSEFRKKNVALQETFQALYDHRDENFGNAREVRNTFEDAVARQANRVAGLAKPSKEDLMAILPEDLSD